MTNALYDKGRNKFARGDINWLASAGDTIKVCLVKAAYVQDLAVHEWFSDLGANVVGNAGAATRAACPTLTLIDPAAGVVDANDATITAVPAGAGACDNIVIFKDSGVDGTSPLLAYIDSATNLPITGNGGDITIAWDNGANKIFKL